MHQYSPSYWGGQDENAWNPANWQVTYERDGLDKFSRKEFNPVDQQYYPHTYIRPWQTNIWMRDFFLPSGEPIVMPVSHEGALPDTIKMESAGTITVHLTWISSNYPAPSEVVVFNYSSVGAGATNPFTASLVARNAYNHNTTGPDANGVLKSQGQKYRSVPISGGHGQYTVSTSASAEQSGPFAAVFALANSHLAVPADRIVAIPNFSVPNFYFNGQSDPSVFPFGFAQNENTDPTDITLDVPIEIKSSTLGRYESPLLYSQFLGNWGSGRSHTSSHQAVNVEVDFLGNPHYSTVEGASRVMRAFSATELDALFNRSEMLEIVQVDADDIARAPRQGVLTLRYHTPFEKLKPATTILHEFPEQLITSADLPYNGHIGITDTLTVSLSVSESISFGAEFEIHPDIFAWLVQSVKPYAGFSIGRTASIARSMTRDLSYTNPNQYSVHVEFYRHPYMNVTTQPLLVYGEHGFQGTDEIILNSFVSKDPHLAEQFDARSEIRVRRLL